MNKVPSMEAESNILQRVQLDFKPHIISIIKDTDLTKAIIGTKNEVVIFNLRKILERGNFEETAPPIFKKKENLERFEVGKSDVEQLECSPNYETRSLVGISSGNTAWIYNINRLETQTHYARLQSHISDITNLKWAPQIPYFLATSSTDGHCAFWDIREPDKPVSIIQYNCSGIYKIAWNRIDEKYISTAHDGVICLWDYRKSKEPISTMNYYGHAIGLEFSYRSANTIMLATNNEIKLLNTKPIFKEDVNIQYSKSWKSLTNVKFTPFGNGITTTTRNDSKIKTYLIEDTQINNKINAKQIKVFSGHKDIVKEYDYRIWENSKYQLISVSSDSSLNIYQYDLPSVAQLEYSPVLEELPRNNISGIKHGLELEKSKHSQALEQEFNLLRQDIKLFSLISSHTLNLEQRKCTLTFVQPNLKSMQISFIFPDNFPSYLLKLDFEIIQANNRSLIARILNEVREEVAADVGCLKQFIGVISDKLEQEREASPRIVHSPHFGYQKSKSNSLEIPTCNLDDPVGTQHRKKTFSLYPSTMGIGWNRFGQLLIHKHPKYKFKKIGESVKKIYEFNDLTRVLNLTENTYNQGLLEDYSVSSNSDEEEEENNIDQDDDGTLSKSEYDGKSMISADNIYELQDTEDMTPDFDLIHPQIFHAEDKDLPDNISGIRTASNKHSVMVEEDPTSFITIYSLAKYTPINHNLAGKYYSLQNHGIITEYIKQNAEITSAKYSALSRAWKLLEFSLTGFPYDQTKINTWKQHPFGLSLFNELLFHFEKKGDIQHLSLFALPLLSVLYIIEKRLRHQRSDIERMQSMEESKMNNSQKISGKTLGYSNTITNTDENITYTGSSESHMDFDMTLISGPPTMHLTGEHYSAIQGSSTGKNAQKRHPHSTLSNPGSRKTSFNPQNSQIDMISFMPLPYLNTLLSYLKEYSELLHSWRYFEKSTEIAKLVSQVASINSKRRYTNKTKGREIESNNRKSNKKQFSNFDQPGSSSKTEGFELNAFKRDDLQRNKLGNLKGDLPTSSLSSANTAHSRENKHQTYIHKKLRKVHKYSEGDSPFPQEAPIAKVGAPLLLTNSKSLLFPQSKNSKPSFVITHCEVCQLKMREPSVVCQFCNHGGHFEHFKTWFIKQRRCPNPDCQCECASIFNNQ